MANAQDKIEITANGRIMTATLADTDAARQFKTQLEKGSISVRMSDYGGFEKVGELPWPLPASDSHITTSAGDIMLYLGHDIVIFYGSNSWAYTPLGKIDGAGASEIREFLSGSSIDVTFSKEQSGVDGISADSSKHHEVLTLQGQRVDLGSRQLSDLPKGIYIIDGRKQVIR